MKRHLMIEVEKAVQTPSGVRYKCKGLAYLFSKEELEALVPAGDELRDAYQKGIADGRSSMVRAKALNRPVRVAADKKPCAEPEKAPTGEEAPLFNGKIRPNVIYAVEKDGQSFYFGFRPAKNSQQN